jgi:hypothetical protein
MGEGKYQCYQQENLNNKIKNKLSFKSGFLIFEKTKNSHVK